LWVEIHLALVLLRSMFKVSNIDWSATGSMLSGFASIGVLIAAIWGLSTWKREIIGRRRINLAEEALTAFYNAKDKIEYARNGASFGTEGEFPTDETDENIKRHAFAMNTPAKRLIDESEFFSDFRSMKFKVKAHFGQEADQIFNDVLKARVSVITASQAVARAAINRYEDRENQQEFLGRMRERMWESYGEEQDAIKISIDTSVDEAEKIFGKILSGRVI